MSSAGTKTHFAIDTTQQSNMAVRSDITFVFSQGRMLPGVPHSDHVN
jgi:hypothetical protein